MSLIVDERELSSFKKFLPDLERDEVYFLSLSARNKYLSKEERLEYSLGQTEMFSRKIAFDKDGIDLALGRMAADLKTKRTRNGSVIPTKCLVVYINIHPSSTIKAYRSFTKQMDQHYEEAFLGCLNGSDSNDMFIPFHRITTTLMNHIQKTPSRKPTVDIDVDGVDEDESLSLVSEVTSFLDSHKCGYVVVKTQGGYHVLIPTKYLSKAVPLWQVVRELNSTTEGEVMFNSNAMVPLPGTLQANKRVVINAHKVIV